MLDRPIVKAEELKEEIMQNYEGQISDRQTEADYITENVMMVRVVVLIELA